MAFRDCLQTAYEGREISLKDHDRLLKEFSRARERAAQRSPVGAEKAAKEELLDQLKRENAAKRRQAKLSIDAVKRIDGHLMEYRNGRGRRDIGRAALLLLEHYGEAPFESVAAREQSLAGEALARMGNVLAAFRRSRLAGDKVRHNRAQLDNVVRELFGEKTGDAAAGEMAAAATDAMEFLRLRYNAAGGSIAKLEKWGLPQHHDAVALRRRMKEPWKQDIKPLLDAGRMVHPVSGKPVTEGELDGVLDAVFDSIVSDGMNKLEPSMQPFGRGALANRRTEHRFLVFKSADAWLEYQRAYGGADPFATMMEHVRMMSRDIAAMEVLGPNPNGTIEWLKQRIERDAGVRQGSTSKDVTDKAKQNISRLEEVWSMMRGATGSPVNKRMARAGGGLRNWMSASLLGGAALSSITDIGTGFIARKFAGVGGSVMRDYIRALTPTGRQDAIDAGLILDEALNALHQEARYVGAIEGTGLTNYLVDRVVSLTGLTAWTQAGRHAWGLSFFREAAKQAGRPWEKLHPAFRGRFEAYGLTSKEWDAIRAAGTHRGQTGLELLRPAEVEKIDPQLASRYLGMVQMDAEYAVPSGGYRSRSYLINQSKPGELGGELLRMFAQLKSFGGVYAMIFGQRIYRMAMGKDHGNPMVYAGALLLSTTVLGAFATQLKQVAAGRDPRPMTSPEFWGAAMMQGGGIGLYGDFLFADLNRYGGGLPMSIGGPAIEHLGDFLNLTIGNAIQLANGEKTNFGKELVQFMRGNVPGGNIWYLRLAWERLVLDQAQALADPEANKAFKRRQQTWQRDFGQGFWWKPGQAAPDRAPDLGNALGGG